MATSRNGWNKKCNNFSYIFRINEEVLTEQEKQEIDERKVEMSFFLKDLLMSLEDLPSDDNKKDNNKQSETKVSVKKETKPLPSQHSSAPPPSDTKNDSGAIATNTSSNENLPDQVVRQKYKESVNIDQDVPALENEDIQTTETKRRVVPPCLLNQSRERLCDDNVVHESADARPPHMRYSGRILLTNEYLGKN